MPLSPGAITGIVVGSVMGGILLAAGGYMGVEVYWAHTKFSKASEQLMRRVRVNLKLQNDNPMPYYLTFDYKTKEGEIIEMGYWASVLLDQRYANEEYIKRIINDTNVTITKADTQARPSGPDFEIVLSSKDKFDALFN